MSRGGTNARRAPAGPLAGPGLLGSRAGAVGVGQHIAHGMAGPRRRRWGGLLEDAAYFTRHRIYWSDQVQQHARRELGVRVRVCAGAHVDSPHPLPPQHTPSSGRT